MLLDPKLENPHASKPLEASHFKESDQLISMANRSKYQREKQECLLEIFHFFGVWIDFQGRNVWEFLIQPFCSLIFPKGIESPSPPSCFLFPLPAFPEVIHYLQTLPRTFWVPLLQGLPAKVYDDWPFTGGILGLGFAPISRYDSLEKESSSEINLQISWWILLSNVSICRSFWEKSSFVEGILVEARGNHHQSLTSYYLYQSRCYSHF